MKTNYHATLEAQVCYHIYNRSVGKELLFRKPENYHFFLQQWQKYLGHYFSVYAYCLLPNHFHVLAKCKSPNRAAIEIEDTNKSKAFIADEIPYHTFLESQFKRFFNSYSAAYNNAYERTGSLWQAKFKRIAIAEEAKFTRLLWYVHHNPIHHGYTADYDAWKFSSYPAYLKKIDTPLALAKPVILQLFSDKEDTIGKANFQKFHEENILGSRKAKEQEMLKLYGIDT